jgi:hypothetical protein
MRVREGAAGNARLTAAVAVVLLILLAAEGATIPFIGSLLGPHIFIGMLLIPPVALKLPHIVLRLLAPGVVLTTVALFGTGVALLLAGPPGNTLILVHKVSFIVWVALMTAHVLGHLLEVPVLASADWRRAGPTEARLAGAGPRVLATGSAVLCGALLAGLTLSLARPWL